MAVTTSPQEIAAYIRVSALAISLFEYDILLLFSRRLAYYLATYSVVQTLPGEFRLYARQRSIFRLR